MLQVAFDRKVDTMLWAMRAHACKHARARTCVHGQGVGVQGSSADWTMPGLSFHIPIQSVGLLVRADLFSLGSVLECVIMSTYHFSFPLRYQNSYRKSCSRSKPIFCTERFRTILLELNQLDRARLSCPPRAKPAWFILHVSRSQVPVQPTLLVGRC